MPGREKLWPPVSVMGAPGVTGAETFMLGEEAGEGGDTLGSWFMLLTKNTTPRIRARTTGIAINAAFGIRNPERDGADWLKG